MFSSDTILNLEYGTKGETSTDEHRTSRKTSDGVDWLLAPYETKTINSVRVVGSVERNTTSFVHVRARLGPMSGSPTSKESRDIVLLIPMEIVVGF